MCSLYHGEHMFGKIILIAALALIAWLFCGCLIVWLMQLYQRRKPGAAVAGLAAYGGACGLVWSAQLVRYLPIVAYRIAPPSLWIITTYYGAASAAWIVWRWRVRIGSGAGWSGGSGGSCRPSEPGRSDGTGQFALRRIASIALRVCVAIAFTSAGWILLDPRRVVAARGDGVLHVTVLDVGQGDSSFIAESAAHKGAS